MAEKELGRWSAIGLKWPENGRLLFSPLSSYLCVSLSFSIIIVHVYPHCIIINCEYLAVKMFLDSLVCAKIKRCRVKIHAQY